MLRRSTCGLTAQVFDISKAFQSANDIRKDLHNELLALINVNSEHNRNVYGFLSYVFKCVSPVASPLNFLEYLSVLISSTVVAMCLAFQPSDVRVLIYKVGRRSSGTGFLTMYELRGTPLRYPMLQIQH